MVNTIKSKEFAQICHVSEQTVIRWRSANKGPSFYRIGRSVFYPEQEAKEWAKNYLRTGNV